jgi:uncharacterized protein YggE
MKNTSTTLIALLLCVFYFNLYAQIGGNQVYQSNSSHYDRDPAESLSIYSNDSTLIITSRVLMNQEADHYLLTVGVNQFGKTVIEANNGLTIRIDNVLKKIKRLGVNDSDISIDFISETKQYDHVSANDKITEFFDGFSIRKNIIIKVDELTKIDAIIQFCSEEEIHDIIKVDYVSSDLEMINDKLFEEALKINQKKRDRFAAISTIQLTGESRLSSDKFMIYYPKNHYKKYNEAFESTLSESQYNSHLAKRVRKETTYFYDGVETELGVDKIIDETSPTVGIQYVLEIQVVYKLKK